MASPRSEKLKVDAYEKTVEEVGRELNVSFQRARVILANAQKHFLEEARRRGITNLDDLLPDDHIGGTIGGTHRLK